MAAMGAKYSSSCWQYHQDISTEDSILFMPSGWHKEAPAPSQTMSRVPYCLSHGLNNEGNNSCEIMPAHEKFALGISGASCAFIGQENKGGRRGEEDGGLGEGRRMVDWTHW
jgi:hypothetical protein